MLLSASYEISAEISSYAMRSFQTSALFGCPKVQSFHWPRGGRSSDPGSWAGRLHQATGFALLTLESRKYSGAMRQSVKSGYPSCIPNVKGRVLYLVSYVFMGSTLWSPRTLDVRKVWSTPENLHQVTSNTHEYCSTCHYIKVQFSKGVDSCCAFEPSDCILSIGIREDVVNAGIPSR